jgi:hypothetical protein
MTDDLAVQEKVSLLTEDISRAFEIAGFEISNFPCFVNLEFVFCFRFRREGSEGHTTTRSLPTQQLLQSTPSINLHQRLYVELLAFLRWLRNMLSLDPRIQRMIKHKYTSESDVSFSCNSILQVFLTNLYKGGPETYVPSDMQAVQLMMLRPTSPLELSSSRPSSCMREVWPESGR